MAEAPGGVEATLPVVPQATSIANFTAITFTTLVVDRVFGLALTILASAAFGTGRQMDAYLLAIAGPTVLAALASDMLWSSLFPVLQVPAAAKRQVIWTAMAWSGALLLVLTVVFLTAAFGLTAFRPLTPDESSLVRQLILITSPLILLGGLSSAAATALIDQRRLVAASIRIPLATLSSVIAFLLLYRATGSIFALAAGVLIGNAIGTIFTLVCLLRTVSLPNRFGAVLPREQLRKLSATSLWQFAVGLMSQGPLPVERLIGFGLGSGTISALNYGRTVVGPPLLIGQSLANGVYPRLVAVEAEAAMEKAAAVMSSAISMIVFLVLPVAVVLVGFRVALVQLVFHRGAFSDSAVLQTAAVAAILAVGLLPMSVTTLFVRLLYARRQSHRVAAASGVALLAYVILAWALAHYWGLIGLAAAGPGSSVVLLIALLLAVPQSPAFLRAALPSIGRSAVAASAMTLLILLVQAAAGHWGLLTGGQVVVMLVGTTGALVVYAGAALALRSPDARSIVGWSARLLGAVSRI